MLPLFLHTLQTYRISMRVTSASVLEIMIASLSISVLLIIAPMTTVAVLIRKRMNTTFYVLIVCLYHYIYMHVYTMTLVMSVFSQTWLALTLYRRQLQWHQTSGIQ